MRGALGIACLLVGTLGAGCIGDSGEDVETLGSPDAELADVAAALEAGEPRANFQPLTDWRDGGTQEAAVWGDYLFADRGSEVVILDVSDPMVIEELGSIALPGVLDVKVSDDGLWMFTGEDQEISGPPLGGTGPLTGGFYVTDIADKTNPTLVSYLPVGMQRGPHMVTYHRHPDGSEVLYGASGDAVVIATFDRASGELTEVSRYQPGLLAQNADPRVIDVYYGARAWVHDIFVMSEPDGTVLMYVAAWDAGVHIVDVTDAANPVALGSWNEFVVEEETGNVHTVATQWIGDRRITVAAVEVGFNIVGGVHYVMGNERSALYVLDTTDPANIHYLSTWANPIDPTSGRDVIEGVSSTHNLQIEDGRVYLAHYTLGVWVLDVSTPETQAAPEILAYDLDYTSVWDVVLNHGVMYSSGQDGIVAMRFVRDVVGPTGITSRA